MIQQKCYLIGSLISTCYFIFMKTQSENSIWKHQTEWSSL